jgi:hypothetical protein
VTERQRDIRARERLAREVLDDQGRIRHVLFGIGGGASRDLTEQLMLDQAAQLRRRPTGPVDWETGGREASSWNPKVTGVVALLPTEPIR